MRATIEVRRESPAAEGRGCARYAGVAGPVDAGAEKQYDPGVTDSETKICNTMPYSGPASAYALIGRMSEAYFNIINAQGGVNGRKLNSVPTTMR